jgi:dTMP kinase
MNRRGLFLALEGIDKAGKETQRKNLVDWLPQFGRIVNQGSEPNDVYSPFGIEARSCLDGVRPKPLDDDEFQRLFVLDRAFDIFDQIRPALDRGEIVVFERYALSTIAYGMLSGLGPERYIDLHTRIIGDFMIWPDITVILDIPAELAMERLEKDKKKAQHFEKLSLLTAVRQNYLSLTTRKSVSRTTVVVDATGSRSEVFDLIAAAIEPTLREYGIM